MVDIRLESTSYGLNTLIMNENYVIADDDASYGISVWNYQNGIPYGYAANNYVVGRFYRQYVNALNLPLRNNYISGTLSWDHAAALQPRHMSNNVAWDPGNLIDGASETKAVTVNGAMVGDPVSVGLTTITNAGWQISGQVTAADTVTATLTNHTGGTVDLDSGLLRADVWGHTLDTIIDIHEADNITIADTPTVVLP